jgi:ACS family glucarate transporter-like MFS transporter
MLDGWGWRWSFAGLSLLGFAWAGLWWLWFRDPNKVSETRAASGPFEWRAVRGQVALACGQYFASNFTFFLCLTWMFSYLQGRYGLSVREAALYSAVPLVAGAASQWISGMVVDRLYRRAPGWSRRGPAAAGFVLAATGLLALPYAATPLAASLLFACAAFGADSTISPSWTFCQDIGGGRTGSVSGAMNMVGNFGALASASLFPLLRGSDGQPGPYFAAAAVLNGLAAVAWLGMKGRRSY